jgi:hypothetical protein
MVRALLVLVAALGACRRPVASPPPQVVQVPVATVPVEPPWIRTREAVQVAADSGRFVVADSILASFIQNEAGSPDVGEAAFWRAMLVADPRNPSFSPAAARAALESYLGSEGATRRIDATVLLRQLAISDSLRTAQASQRASTELRDKVRDEELQRLRDELARTQAELERIKRRLGSKP